MKKSLIGVLIALCLIVALIPVLASADTEPKVAGWYFSSTECKVTQGGETLYYTTNENGVATKTGANEDNYNIKVEYPEGADATPILYLRGAYITGQYRSIGNDALPSGAVKTPLTIIVEENPAGTVTVGDDSVETDSYLGFLLNWSGGPLEIRGPGKLKMVSNINVSNQPLTFKDADVEITVTGASQACIAAKGVTFDGGKVVMQSAYAAYLDTNTDERIIEVKGGADVSITSTANTALYITNANAKILVNSGSFKAESQSSSHTALQLNNKNFVINGGTVELKGTYRCATTEFIPDLSGYACYYATVSNSTDGSNATQLGTQTLNYYRNFKVVPAYSVTVTGGTASPANAPAGKEVTLTPDNAPAGKLFDGWTSDVTIENNKFIMPAGNVTVTANFIDDPNNDGEPATVGFWFAGNQQMINRGAAPIYLITNASGAATTTGATEDNYNIKLTYENGKTPVISLRGAYLQGTYGALHNNNQSSGNLTNNERASKVTIIIEDELGNATSAVPSGVTADAYIVSYILLSKGDVEIQGPGKLVVDKATSGTTDIAGNIQAGKNLIFKDADVEVLNGAIKATDVTFNGGKVAFTFTSNIISDYANTTRTILVNNGAEVSLTSTAASPMHLCNPNATLQIDSGSLLLKSNATGNNTENAALKVSGGAKVKVNGGTLELSGGVAVVTGDIALDLSEYANYYASCANNTEGTGAIAYTGTTIKQYNSSFLLKYFKLEPAHAITVNGGTANPSAAPAGVVVTLSPTVPQGKEFVKWNVDAGSTTITIENNKFTMPDGPVSVTAEFKDATTGDSTPAGHTHSTTLVKGKAASCTAAGEKDYYKCSCGKFFEDKAAKKEITNLNTWKVIKATGHKDADKDGKCDVCKSAQTSDSSFTALWITLMTVSAMGICVTFVYNKKMRATK